METPNTEILRTRVDVFVLNAVSKNDGYGYDILNYIQTRTEGHYEMKQSSVYNVLKRLETEGYIRSYQGNESNGGKRRYYAITETGKEFLDSQKKEWEYSRTLIDNLISNRVFDLQKETPPFKPSDLRPFTPRKQKDDAIEEIITDTDSRIDNSGINAEKAVAFNNAIASILSKDAEEDIDEPSVAAPAASIPNAYEAVAATATTSAASKTDKAETEDESYRILFEEIFAKNEKIKEEAKDVDTTIDCKHINDLRLLLNKEGHKLNTFAPSSNKNYMRYLLTGKLYRDISLLSYLFLALMLLVVYLAKNSFNASGTALLTVGCVAVVVPIIFLVQYFINPTKRKKDNVRLNVVLPICLVVYLGFLVLNIIIELLIPNGYSINSPQIYAPSIVALVIPFSGIIFTLFYKSEIYHQKVK